MLNGTLALHDVRDIEKLAGNVVKHESLSASDKSDLVAFLIATAWQLAEKYDSSKGSITFSTYATTTLQKRVIDGKRKRFGDGRYRKTPPPVVISLDDVELADPHSMEDLEGELSEAFDNLSHEATWTLHNLAIPISEGWKVTELAKEHGQSAAGVNERMDALRMELEPCL